ncbi:MAG: hypothetical protein IV100_20955 [Myxococcales bacterium]|nr:hypothetical protein [Myxococcales bacterium]
MVPVLIVVGALALGCETGTSTPSDVVSAEDAPDSPDVRGDDVGPDAEHLEPTPWIYPPEDTPIEPSLDAGTRAAALAAALDAVLALSPDAVQGLQDLLYPRPAPGQGDPTGCPFVLTYDYGPTKAYYWQGECTASDGTRFSGQGYSSWTVGLEADGLTSDGFEVNLAGRIEAADGTFLEGAGTVAAYAGRNADARAFGRSMNGTFSAGGPRAPADAWLSGKRRPTLRVDGWVYVPTGGHNLLISGGISGLDGFPGGATAVSFDGLTLRDAFGGATCFSEPGGDASVRGPDGNWFDIAFDGPTDAAPVTDAESCDTCGASWFRGSPVDPTCLDTAPFLVWTGDSPW